jgi:hypothetical protein
MEIPCDMTWAASEVANQASAAHVFRESVQQMTVEGLVRELGREMFCVGLGCGIVAVTNVHRPILRWCWERSPTSDAGWLFQPDPLGVGDLADKALAEIVRRDAKHPSLAVWSMANECETSDELGIRATHVLRARARSRASRSAEGDAS